MRRFIFGLMLVFFVAVSVVLYFATAPTERDNLSVSGQEALTTALT